MQKDRKPNGRLLRYRRVFRNYIRMATADISGCEPKRSRVIDNDFGESFGSRQFNTATKPPIPRTGSKPLSFKAVKEHSLQNEEELIPGSQPQPREVTPTRDYTIMVVQENEEVD